MDGSIRHTLNRVVDESIKGDPQLAQTRSVVTLCLFSIEAARLAYLHPESLEA